MAYHNLDKTLLYKIIIEINNENNIFKEQANTETHMKK